MKPLRLCLSAFGPFAKEVEINFEPYRNGLFLIAGDTGSGKTTIFDAFMYALYGETTQIDRDADQMRSDFALAETTTFVELDFQVKGELYKIMREPSYLRPKLRGEGMIHNTSQVEMTLPNGKVLTLKNEVKQKVEQLLGLDAEQFKQTSLLPQGDFKQLLSSEQQEREQIFRKIFNTKKIIDFQEFLKKQTVDLTSERDLKQRDLIQTIHNMKSYPELGDGELIELAQNINQGEMTFVDQFSDLFSEYIKKLLLIQTDLKQKNNKLNIKRNKTQKQYEESIQLEQQFIELDLKKSELKDVEKNLEKMESKQEVYKIKQYTALYINTLYSQWQVNQKSLANRLEQEKNYLTDLELSRKNLQNVEEEFEYWQGQSKVLDQEYIALNKLEEGLAQYTEYDSIYSQFTDLKNENEVYKKTKIDLNNKIKLVDQQKKELEAKMNYLGLLEKDNHELKLEHNSLESDYEQKYKLLENWQELREQASQINTLEIKYESISEKFREAEVEFNHYQNIQKQQSAAYLAKDLVDGEPCPVCGQTDHVVLAEFDVNFDEEIMLKKEAQLKLARKNADDLKIELTALKLGHAQLLNSVQREFEKMNLLADFDLSSLDLYTNFQAEIEKLFKAKQELEIIVSEQIQQIEQYSDHKNEFDVLVKQEEKRLLELHELETKIQTNNIEQAKLETKIEAVKKNLQYPDLNQAQESYQKLNQEYQKKLESKKDSEINYNKCLRDQTSLETKIEQVATDLEQLETDQQELLNEIKERAAVKNLKFEELAQYIISGDQLTAEEKEINIYFSNIQALRQSIKELSLKTENASKPDLKQLKIQLETTEQDLEESKLKAHDLNQIIEDNIKLSKLFVEYCQEYNQLEKKTAKISKLSRLANGMSGESRRTFEAFVQSYYFQRMLEASNLRLEAMSNGRYYLNRKSDITDRRKRGGLEFEIFDTHTGKNRPASTLSGGESFLAALALALGLSDTVQKMQGGVEIETLFIDEGFGSLDSDALEQAIRALESLSEGNRMIGIISHVPDLKSRIDRQIQVIGKREGSDLRCIF